MLHSTFCTNCIWLTFEFTAVSNNCWIQKEDLLFIIIGSNDLLRELIPDEQEWVVMFSQSI